MLVWSAPKSEWTEAAILPSDVDPTMWCHRSRPRVTRDGHTQVIPADSMVKRNGSWVLLSYPLVMTNIAIEHGPFIVDIYPLKMVDPCIVMLVYQRVSHLWYPKRLSKATPVLHTVPFVFLWGNWLEWVQNSKKIMGFKPTVDFLHLGTDRNRKFMSVASSTCPKPGAGQRHVLLFFFLTKIVMWVKQCHKPSPSHHHFYRW